MMKLLLITLLALLLVGAVTGCESSGSKEFVPGRGWVPNDY